MRAANRRRVQVVLQTARSDCGPACLAMVLAACGRPRSLVELRDLLDPGRDGVTALDLRDAGRAMGLHVRAVRIDPAGAGGTPLRSLRMPVIAHWAGQHFVVVERVGRDRVTVVDPAVGRRRLGAEASSALVGGVALEFLEPAGVDRPTGPATRRTTGPMGAPSSTCRLLAPVVRRHQALLVRVLVVSLVLTLLGLALPMATAAVTAQLAAERTVPPSLLALVAGLGVTVGSLAGARALAVARVQRSIGDQLGGGTVARLLEAPYRYFERRDTGDLVARVGSADAVRDALAGSLVAAVLDGVLACGYLLVVASLDPALALVAAGMLVVQLALALHLTARTRVLHREELVASAAAQSRLVQAIGGIAAVRTAGAEPWVLEAWRQLYRRQLDAAARRAQVSAVLDAVLTAGRVAGPVLLLLVAVRAGGDAASLGRQLGLAALATAALAPVPTLAAQARVLGELGPLLDRLADAALAPPEQDGPRPPAPRLRGRVDLHGVTFRYDRRAAPALADVTLHVEPGTKVGVVGASGSGKSTLTKLLSALHQPTEGRVLLDGHDLAGLDLRSVRRQLGVVLQEPFLAGTTIREAICLGHDDIGDAHIRRVARLAAVHDDVVAMPLGYDTPIGEAGRGLSGGQRQRLALARALLGEPAVLVLDEATSALDVETEARVEAALRSLSMTRVVVAHRLSTIADADVVVVLDGGVVVECGPPVELVRRGGRYAAMVAAAGAADAPAATGVVPAG